MNNMIPAEALANVFDFVALFARHEFFTKELYKQEIKQKYLLHFYVICFMLKEFMLHHVVVHGSIFGTTVKCVKLIVKCGCLFIKHILIGNLNRGSNGTARSYWGFYSWLF